MRRADVVIVGSGVMGAATAYWLTRLQSRPETSGMRSFREWLCRAVADQPPATG